MADRPERIAALVRWMQDKPADRAPRRLSGFRLLFGDLTDEEIAAAIDIDLAEGGASHG